MREPLTKDRLRPFFEAMAANLPSGGRIYITGGASALLFDWRTSTLDVDISADPEPVNFFPAISRIKEELQINIEIASPAKLVPPLPGWQSRSKFIDTFRKTDFYHFDFYTQAFSKIVCSHARDIADVENMLNDGLIAPSRLSDLYHEVADQILRYPRLDPQTVTARITDWCTSHS